MISWGASALIGRLLVSYRQLAHKSIHSSQLDARALARYLGRPVPAFRAMPISALNFCSYDGVLRGPFAFRLSADELKHSSVRSIDHK